MPFVTEALWASLPHRATDPELLIVARWPGVGEADPAAEREVAMLIDLVGEIRNARASAKLPAADWLETLVYVPRRARSDLRGAQAGHRATRPRPAAPSRADPRGARGGRPDRATSRSSSPVARSRRPSGPRRPTPTPTPSNATDSSATWPKPRAGWRPPASDSPTSRSSRARRPPSSRAPVRARPSSPTRSPGCASERGADGARRRTRGWSEACLSTVLTKPVGPPHHPTLSSLLPKPRTARDRVVGRRSARPA